jgi:hypothetical protein
VADTYRDIEAEIPRLRRYARALTRDNSAADDLVQDCLTRALGKLHLWQRGTDLRAWLFTILHNQYVNYVRRSVREGAAVGLTDSEPLLTRAATRPVARTARSRTRYRKITGGAAISHPSCRFGGHALRRGCRRSERTGWNCPVAIVTGTRSVAQLCRHRPRAARSVDRRHGAMRGPDARRSEIG